MDTKPICPRCRQNINIVKFRKFYKCAFCGTKVKFPNSEQGQQKLIM